MVLSANALELTLKELLVRLICSEDNADPLQRPLMA
jgi:hypothetical protein